MKNLLGAVYEYYDYIIIDSPPMTNLADPVILSRLVDGVILVVNADKSNRDVVRRSRRELLSVGANILGVVLNITPVSHEKYRYSETNLNTLREEITGARFPQVQHVGLKHPEDRGDGPYRESSSDTSTREPHRVRHDGEP
jgi:Mrp family chromosome partitioning ATPase